MTENMNVANMNVANMNVANMNDGKRFIQKS